MYLQDLIETSTLYYAVLEGGTCKQDFFIKCQQSYHSAKVKTDQVILHSFVITQNVCEIKQSNLNYCNG